MWASVPHRDAARTRTRTSEGPQGGASTSAHSSAPGRGATLRIAFIESLSVAGWGNRVPETGIERVRGRDYKGSVAARATAIAWRRAAAALRGTDPGRDRAPGGLRIPRTASPLG